MNQNSEFLSPLTSSKQVKLLKTIEVGKLINDWKNYLNIDITDELHGCKQIDLYECQQTRLRFFVPSTIAGSGKLYEELAKIDWYYMPRKWEHDVAIHDLRNCSTVLEIGAGRGAFVERLCKEVGLDAQGIELNLSAVHYAESRGIPVHRMDLYDLIDNQPSYFDAVCSFQVLEHVPNPKEFLLACTKLLKPNGLLVISVPNSEAFPKYYQKNLLDQPPHHMTQWSIKTFKSLPSLLPLQIERFRIEPLAHYHVDWYIEIQESRLPEIHLLKPLALMILHRVLKPFLHRFSWIRALIRGHTLYVLLKKAD